MITMSSDEYHLWYLNDHCVKCGANVGLGGPNNETYGWATEHRNWHIRLDRSLGHFNA